MRENCTSGTVRGTSGNRRSYRSGFNREKGGDDHVVELDIEKIFLLYACTVEEVDFWKFAMGSELHKNRLSYFAYR
jgi:hypothetical protein